MVIKLTTITKESKALQSRFIFVPSVPKTAMEYFILRPKHLHRKLRSFSKAPKLILSKLPLLNLSLRCSHRGAPWPERHIIFVRQSLSKSNQAHSDTNLTVTQGNITIHFITYMPQSCNRLRNHSWFFFPILVGWTVIQFGLRYRAVAHFHWQMAFRFRQSGHRDRGRERTGHLRFQRDQWRSLAARFTELTAQKNIGVLANP